MPAIFGQDQATWLFRAGQRTAHFGQRRSWTLHRRWVALS